jgi:chorismate mutase
MAFKKSDRQLMFHKALAERGPVRVTVDADARYLKSKDAYVIDLTVGTDKVGYWAENEACKSFFDGQKGRTFTIIAEGSRDSATITYVGEQAPPSGALPPAPAANRPPPQAPAQAPAAPAPQAAAPATRVTNGRDAVDKLRGGMIAAGQVGVALQLAAEQCLTAAEGFYARMTGAAMTAEIRTGFINHIAETMCDGETLRSALISLDRLGAVGSMPAKMTAEMVAAVKERSKAAKAAAEAKRKAAEAAAAAAKAAAEAARAAAAPKAAVAPAAAAPDDDDVNY